MAGDEHAVGGEAGVDLDPLEAGGDGRLEGRQRVLAGAAPGAAVAAPHRGFGEDRHSTG